jgi:hypothetical protein
MASELWREDDAMTGSLDEPSLLDVFGMLAVEITAFIAYALIGGRMIRSWTGDRDPNAGRVVLLKSGLARDLSENQRRVA